MIQANQVGESSFNMTMEDEDIKGGDPKIFPLQNQQEGWAPKKLNH